jgi:OOP family OmpA-OmpF porin
VGVNAGFRANFGGTPARYGLDAGGDPVLEHGVFEYGQLLTAGLGLSARVAPPLDVVAETYSSALVTGENALAQRVSAEAIGGLKVFIDGKSFLYLGGGPGYAPGFQTATARGTLGFVFEPSIGDRDHDGIKDDVDDCPDRAEDIDGFQDDNGCPEPDNDEDGTFDVDDACPNDAGKPSKDPNKNGCPASGDPDKDGILEGEDACPIVAGVKTNDAKTNGCPKEKPAEPPVIVGVIDIFMLEKVQFQTASATILPASDGVLDALARIFEQHPELLLVEIQGHADERGSEKYNLELTEARARAVMVALVKRNVEPKRLRSIGYGPYCPNEPGHDEAAWEANRRVELKIVRKDDGPTGAILGCELATSKGVVSPPP